MIRWSLKSLLFCLSFCLLASCIQAQDDLEGRWELELKSDATVIRCGVELKRKDKGWSAALINGKERIPVQVQVEQKSVVLSMPHYDSKVDLSVVRDNQGTPVMNGGWQKRRGPNEWVRMTAQMGLAGQDSFDRDAAKKFAGRWKVKFSDSEDPAVGIFKVGDDGQLLGTFLTTTGDYRFLAGEAKGNRMNLSCFDGAHAFSFAAKLGDDKTKLTGDFWSSNTWHETFTAVRDPEASLPDGFQQTLVNQKVKLGDFEFPDLDGTPLNLDAENFRGKPRLIYVFGSWCPNCHDAAAYFSELDKKYGPKGLSILGIAFELTGDFERDAKQVKRYLKRHRCTYPVVIAGTSDKRLASRTFPLLDRVRSYPTTIFVDKTGKVTAIHTGFSGPATGAAFERLQRRFESEIDSLIE